MNIMCWRKYSTIKPFALTAEKDIQCFKVVLTFSTLPNTILSPYNYFRYEIGQEYHLEEEIKVLTSAAAYEIYQGFHSYSEEVEFRIDKDEYQIKFGPKKIDWFPLSMGSGINILKCIIPEGSEYFLNDQGEYVSNCIKPIKLKPFI